MAIELRIEELVLRGFAGADGQRIAREVERQLARLIGQDRLPASLENLNLARMDGGAFRLAQGANAQAAGAQIAQSLYRSLQQNARPQRRNQQATGAGRR